MTRVSATEFKNNIGTFSDVAMTRPVIITSHQRDRLVLISAEEYNRLISQSESPAQARKRDLRESAEYHRDTIVELSNR